MSSYNGPCESVKVRARRDLSLPCLSLKAGDVVDATLYPELGSVYVAAHHLKLNYGDQQDATASAWPERSAVGVTREDRRLMSERSKRPINCPRPGCLSTRVRVRYVREPRRDTRTFRHRECRECGYRWVTVQEPERFHRRDQQKPV